MVGTRCSQAESRNSCEIVFGEPEGMIPLDMLWRRWEGITRIHFKGLDWIGLDSYGSG
jgi:hypothetical protein